MVGAAGDGRAGARDGGRRRRIGFSGLPRPRARARRRRDTGGACSPRAPGAQKQAADGGRRGHAGGGRRREAGLHGLRQAAGGGAARVAAAGARRGWRRRPRGRGARATGGSRARVRAHPSQKRPACVAPCCWAGFAAHRVVKAQLCYFSSFFLLFFPPKKSWWNTFFLCFKGIILLV